MLRPALGLLLLTSRTVGAAVGVGARSVCFGTGAARFALSATATAGTGTLSGAALPVSETTAERVAMVVAESAPRKRIVR